MRRLVLIALLPLGIVCAGDAVASVRGGALPGEQPKVVAGADGVWTVDPADLDGTVLNPNGDRFGDGPPHLAQAPDGTSWAVWSFVNRGDRDVAVSRYDGVAWSAVELVVSANARDDLDPRIGFLATGSPVAVWWQAGTRGDRSPRVVASYWAGSGWSAPVALSREAAWRPGILVDRTTLTVAWETAEGIRIERFSFMVGPNGMPSDPSPFPGNAPPPDNDEPPALPD